MSDPIHTPIASPIPEPAASITNAPGRIPMSISRSNKDTQEEEHEHNDRADHRIASQSEPPRQKAGRPNDHAAGETHREDGEREVNEFGPGRRLGEETVKRLGDLHEGGDREDAPAKQAELPPAK
jgi:hypothetical protein